MVEHQQIEGAPPNMPLVPSTSTSPQSSPPTPLNTPLAFSTPISPRSCSSNRAQQEHFAALHTVIIALITVIASYVLFQFQSKKLSLFNEHGNIMRAAFVMLFFYVIAFMAEFKLQSESSYFVIMKQFTPLFGLLVVILLLFILSLFLGLAASILWAFLVVGPTLKLFQQIIQSIRSIIQYITTNQTGTRSRDVEEA